MSYHQAQFFAFLNGAPSIHTLAPTPAKTHVLVTTDRTVQLLRHSTERGYQLETIPIPSAAKHHVEVIGSAVINRSSSGCTLVAIACAEWLPARGEEAHVNGEDKMIPPPPPPADVILAEEHADAKLYLHIVLSQCEKVRQGSGSDHALASPSSPDAATAVRFELDAAPTAMISSSAQSSLGWFRGVLVFCNEMMLAFGYIDERHTDATSGGAEDLDAFSAKQECVRLNDEQMAAFFPEFVEFQHPVLCAELQLNGHHGRGTIVFGCADGLLRLYRGRLDGDCMSGPMEVRDFHMNGPVTAVTLFHSARRNGSGSWHLAATGAIGHAIVFEDVFGEDSKHSDSATATDATAPTQIAKREMLVGSDKYELLFSIVAADIDLDGEVEILVGTDEQAVLAYKRSMTPITPNEASALDEVMAGNGTTNHWRLMEANHLAMHAFGAIYGLEWLDLNADGVTELVVASATGVYVYEADSEVVCQRVQEMLIALQPNP